MKQQINSGGSSFNKIAITAGITALTMAQLTSCISDNNDIKSLQNPKIKDTGKEYTISIDADKASVHFDINEAKGKGIEYTIYSSQNKEGEISVHINGETTYENIVNAEMKEIVKYKNMEEFQNHFTGDAESTIKRVWNKLLKDIIQGPIELGDDFIKEKDKQFTALEQTVNKTIAYNTIHNQKEQSAPIVSREGNSIKITINNKTIELMSKGMSLINQNKEMSDIYILLVDGKKQGENIVLRKDFNGFTQDLERELKKIGVIENHPNIEESAKCSATWQISK